METRELLARAAGELSTLKTTRAARLSHDIQAIIPGIESECQNCHHSDSGFLSKGYTWCRKHKATFKLYSRQKCFTPQLHSAELFYHARKGSILTLQLKKKHFDDIKSGIKKYEYRLKKPHWEKRLENRDYNLLVLTLGFPKRDDMSKRIILPYLGYIKDIITHEEFGPDPVKVYSLIIARNHLPKNTFKHPFKN